MEEPSSCPGTSKDVVIVISDDDESPCASPPKRSRRGGSRRAAEHPDDEPAFPASPADPKRRRAPRTPRKKAPVVVDSDAKTPNARAPARGRKRAAKAKDDGAEASASHPSGTGVAEQLPSGWSDLPRDLLTRIFSMIANVDVISAGQSCRGWRAAAKLPCVWRKRQLSYDLPANGKKFRDWHAGARTFSRTILFAPCLGRVSCAKTLKSAARSAIATRSKCQVTSAELNGQLKWTVKYIIGQKNSLQDLTLLNPNVEALRTALAQPQIWSLAVTYERDVTKEKYQRQKSCMFFGNFAPGYRVPVVPSTTKGHLKKLVCHSGVELAAVEALVLANAATLEEVGAHCLPLSGLLRCVKLRRLMLKVNPANVSDQHKIKQLLKSKPVEYLAFIGTKSHAKAACAVLRASLRAKVRGCTVVCSACENVCTLEKPQYASRDVPDLDDDVGEFDFLANMFRSGGGCQCICCANQDADEGWSDEDMYMYGFGGYGDFY